jgi:hypothetical protein
MKVNDIHLKTNKKYITFLIKLHLIETNKFLQNQKRAIIRYQSPFDNILLVNINDQKYQIRVLIR